MLGTTSASGKQKDFCRVKESVRCKKQDNARESVHSTGTQTHEHLDQGAFLSASKTHY